MDPKIINFSYKKIIKSLFEVSLNVINKDLVSLMLFFRAFILYSKNYILKMLTTLTNCKIFMIS